MRKGNKVGLEAIFISMAARMATLIQIIGALVTAIIVQEAVRE